MNLPIAVVVPAYNAERFLNETLESIWAQSAQPSEVIVVDDGSTDRTLEIARHHPVTLMRQPNLGPSEARNVAICHTAQPWIAFLDADDVWAADKLEVQWMAVQVYPEAGAVFSDLEWSDRWLLLFPEGALREGETDRGGSERDGVRRGKPWRADHRRELRRAVHTAGTTRSAISRGVVRSDGVGTRGYRLRSASPGSVPDGRRRETPDVVSDP